MRFAPCPRSGRALCALLFPWFLRWCSPFGPYDGCGACAAVGALSNICHSCFPSLPQAVPTEAASERRGEAPTEAQLHSARLTGEADLTKAINIYIFYPNIKRTNATSSSRLSSVLLRYICYLCCLSAHDFWHGTIMGGQVKIFNESTCLPDKA